MPHASPDRRPSLAQRLVLVLSEKIHAGEWPAGSKLPTEQVLTEAHGVSRTTVREALSRLQAEGLVETRRGIGTFVVDAVRPGETEGEAPEKGSACDAVAIVELRLSLEVEAAGIAAQRANAAQLEAMRAALDQADDDFAFDLQIALGKRSEERRAPVSHLGSSLMGDAAPVFDEPQRARWSREREQVFASISRKDVEGARAAMRLHLVNCLSHARAALQHA